MELSLDHYINTRVLLLLLLLLLLLYMHRHLAYAPIDRPVYSHSRTNQTPLAEAPKPTHCPLAPKLALPQPISTLYTAPQYRCSTFLAEGKPARLACRLI